VGLLGRLGEAATYGGNEGWRSGLGQIPGEIELEFYFQISKNFGIWQDFEKFYKEI
jgi:hypothetical protein